MNTRAALAVVVALACGCAKTPAEPLIRVPAGIPDTVVIRNVGVLDVAAGTVAPGRDVVLERGRIASIAGTRESAVPPTALEIDGTGATLLPGLIDLHGHTGQSSAPRWLGQRPDPEHNLQSYLYCGVTTVLDPAGLETQTFELRDRVAAGELPGPRIYAAGPMITAPGGHPVPIFDTLVPWWIRWYLVPRFTRQVATPDEARAAVRDIAGLGADFVKVTVDRIPEQAPRIENEALRAAVDEAGKLGLRGVAHIGSVEDALDAADAGVSLWLHGVYKERVPDEQVARLVAYGIPMVPTLEVYDNYARLGTGPRVPTALERETVSAEVLGAFDHPPQDSEAAEFFGPYLQMLRERRSAWHDNVRRLRAAGVTILAGSDTQSGVFPGPGLHREFHHLVAAGMTPADVIRSATLDAARFLAAGKPPDFGVIAPGKRADLLLVEGDPTADVAALARIRTVIRNGVPLERLPVNNR